MKSGNLIGLNLEVDEQLIAESAKSVIQAAVVAALGDKDALIASVLNSILNKKVKADGTVSNYRDENKHTLLEVYVERAVRETAKEVVQEIIEENRSEFKRLLKKQLTEAKTLDAFTRSFVEGSMEAVSNKYRASININIDNSRG
jgi:Glu-tRNA(Gln) amidotransferase subunit E-like FAD-binding protein